MNAPTSSLLLLGIVIVLIFAAVGIFVATLVYIQRAQSKKGGEGEPEAPSSEPSTQLEAAPEGTPSADGTLSAPEAPARPGEVMRVIRDQETGRVLVEVGGKQYTHIREIQDAQVGRRVLWAIADLIRFTGGMAANPQAVRSLSQQDTSPEGPDAGEARGGGTSRGEKDSASSSGSASGLSTPSSRANPPLRGGTRPATPRSAEERDWDRARTILSTSQESQSTSRSTSMVEFFRRGFQAAPPSTPVPGPSSFIDEIEEILQGYIEQRLEPFPYPVHVQAGPAGRLQILVGTETYGSPEEVRDREVRELIEAAVKEWENS
jgi:hypothetical protein